LWWNRWTWTNTYNGSAYGNNELSQDDALEGLFNGLNDQLPTLLLDDCGIGPFVAKIIANGSKEENDLINLSLTENEIY
jgi:hypothetical protein